MKFIKVHITINNNDKNSYHLTFLCRMDFFLHLNHALIMYNWLHSKFLLLLMLQNNNTIIKYKHTYGFLKGKNSIFGHIFRLCLFVFAFHFLEHVKVCFRISSWRYFSCRKKLLFVVKAQAVHALGKFEDIICFYVPGQNKNFHSLLYHVK